MTDQRLFKSLRRGRVAPHSAFVWPEPGVWEDASAHPEPGVNGLYVATIPQLWRWMNAEVWEVEAEGLQPQRSPSVAQRVRLVRQTFWDERVARMLASDIAEHLLLLLWEDWFELAVDCVKAARMVAHFNDEDAHQDMHHARRAALGYDHGYGKSGPRLCTEPPAPTHGSCPRPSAGPGSRRSARPTRTRTGQP